MITICLGCMSKYDSELGVCPHCGYYQDTPITNTLHMKPGTILHGRYLIGKALGSGGFGVTYVAWDFQLELKIAIKEYLPSEFATRVLGETHVAVHSGNKEIQFASGLERFIEEAKCLAKFKNEDGIVRVYDAFKENNTAYITMEYLEGNTLAAYLKENGKIPFEQAVKILEPAMHSLEVVHKEGIIHRDVAPDNIFLTSDGQVKLIDFGASRYATTSYSRSLSVIIKPGYSPEEQYRSRGDQGPHTDVYALGAVLYKMITGITPPDAMERRAYFETEKKDILIPPSKECTLDKNKETAILNAMNVQIEDRTKDIASFLEELHSETQVKRIAGKIKAIDLMKWPLWAKVSISVAAMCITVLLGLLFTGKIGFLDHLDRQTTMSNDETRIIDATNYSLGIAQEKLYENGLDGYVTGLLSYDVISPYLVVQQDVVAGDRVEKGSMISLSLSKESENSKKGIMPGVLYLMAEEAIELIEKSGGKYEIIYISSGFPKGMVVWANKAKQDKLLKDDVVQILVSEGKKEGDEENLRFNIESTSLYVGDSINLKVIGGDEEAEWKTSDESIVSVSQDGTITAEGKGVAVIQASCGSEIIECYLTVHNYNIKIRMKELAVFVGSKAPITVTGAPGDTKFEWISSDETVAIVEDGMITGVNKGQCNVIAKCDIKGHVFETAPMTVEVASEGLVLSAYDVTNFFVGDELRITANSSAKDKAIEWKSSNEKVIKVVEGRLTAIGEGEAKIHVKCDKFNATCNVTVTSPMVKISSSEGNVGLVGQSMNLVAVASPRNQKISWSSNNEKICTVDDKGEVKLIAKGTADITASIEYKGKTYKDTYRITAGTPSVKLSKTSVSLNKGKSTTLSATTVPSNAKVTWSSSDTSIATVSSKGVVKGIKNGSAKITAKITHDGETYSATCTVKVKATNPTVRTDFPKVFEMYTFLGRYGSIYVTPKGGKISVRSSDTSVVEAWIEETDQPHIDDALINFSAVSPGTANVTTTYTVDGQTVSYTSKVIVVE